MINARTREEAVDNFTEEHPSPSHPISTSQMETKKEIDPTVQPVIDALMTRGLSPDKFAYPDTITSIHELQQAGASLDVFIKAYDISARQTSNFGVNYLIKVVAGLMEKSKHTNATSSPKKHSMNTHSSHSISSTHEPVFEEDLHAAMSWAEDILKEDSS